MATSAFLLFFLSASLTIQFTLSATPPISSPSPSPDSPADSLPSPSPSPSPGSPIPPPSDSPISSPPAPPPSDLASPPPASPSPAESEAPSPAPADLMSDVSHSNNADAAAVVDEDDGSPGLNGGKKAGIAVGVVSAAAVVGVGALVYKKRRDNIRRSQYGYAARREML